MTLPASHARQAAFVLPQLTFGVIVYGDVLFPRGKNIHMTWKSWVQHSGLHGMQVNVFCVESGEAEQCSHPSNAIH